MAFAAGTIWQVDSSGSDTNGGGGFDALSANFATDLAATSATGSSPVVTSASYNFITRDNSQYLYIKAGTNWTPGLYPIVSTSGNAATLNAAVGAVVLFNNGIPIGMNTTAGCATTASPTGGTWGVDYSQGTSPGITYTDMVIDGTTNTKYTSAGFPVGPNVVGNVIAVTSGTGFTVQRVQVASVSGTTATCDKSLGTLSSTGGNGKLGGALASPGMAGGLHVGNNLMAYKAGSTYSISGTNNVSGGRVTMQNGTGSAITVVFGYSTHRHVFNLDTKPVLDAGANSVNIITQQDKAAIFNLAFTNAGTFTSCFGVQAGGGWSNSVIQDCTADKYNTGFVVNIVDGRIIHCLATNCTVAGYNMQNAKSEALFCTANGCTTSFLGPCDYLFCASNNTTNGHGWDMGSAGQQTMIGCVSNKTSGTTKDGFNSTGAPAWMFNCIATDSTGFGFNLGTTAIGNRYLTSCAGYNNTLGNQATGNLAVGFITLTANPFTAPTATPPDLTLNSTAGGGAALKGLGYPTTYPGLTPTNYPNVGAYSASTTSAVGPAGHNMRGGYING